MAKPVLIIPTKPPWATECNLIGWIKYYWELNMFAGACYYSYLLIIIVTQNLVSIKVESR